MVIARRFKLLGLALLMSGGTVVLTQQWLQGAVRQAQVQAQAHAQSPAAQSTGARVLVAAATVPAGTVIKAGDLRWQPWPGDAAGSGYLTAGNTRIDQMTGAVARSALTPGEPLTAARVVQPGDRSVLAAALQPGYRAVTVNVSASSGVAGFVIPGDRVDLILSRAVGGSGSGGQPRFVSETVLSDVRVVGIDQRATNEKKDVVIPTTATLEVTPKGAEVVAVASELGKLSLSLRSLGAADAPADARRVTRTWDRDATQGGEVAVAAHRPAARSAPPVATVQVIRGATASAPGGAQ